MFTVHVEKELEMPIEKAFEAITDHANYHLYAAVDKADLLKSGSDDKNGVGAIREIKSGGMTLQEEIVAYESPHKMAYQIISAKPFAIEHRVGEITLREAGNATKVIWHSEFNFSAPIIGSFLTKFLGPKVAKSFASLLRGMERRYKFFSR